MFGERGVENCKKTDCKYCSNLGNGSGSIKFCDYIGYTVKRRGVYGKDVEHCDKYEKQTEGKKQRRVHIVFGDYEKKHYGEMWG